MTETNHLTPKGKRTREMILDTAANVASIEGLDGLTIGRLASELNMSKSGLFGHFGSKEDLQVATVAAARQLFIDEVITPALQAEAGLLRLWAMCDRWMSFMERRLFPGGCFFVTVATEFDNKPGAVRDIIANHVAEWQAYLGGAMQRAQVKGHLRPSLDPTQAVFELYGLYLSANQSMQLFHDQYAPNRARVAMLNKLQSWATEESPSLPAPEQYPLS